MPSACLTPQVLRDVACPTEKNKIRIYDTKLKGLFLQIRKSGTKSYFLRYRNTRGRNIELKIGDAADLTPVQVRKKAAKLRSQIAMGNDPLAERNVYKNIPSFEQFARDNYLPYIKNYKKSWKTDETLLRIYLIPFLGNKYLDEITKDDTIEIQQDGIKRGAAPASTNRLVILLRYMFNLGLKWKTPGVTDNPTKDVPLLAENNQRERFLTKEETKALYEAILQSGNPMLKFIIPMLILTGARKREVLDAKWEDFDFKRKIWCIAMTKSGKARYIPLSDGVLNLLAEIPRTSNSEYVFANPDTGKPFNSIYRSWNTARNQAGLSEVRMHDLRHSFASFLINSGRSLYEVQKLLGHSQIQTTQRYAHLSQETLLEATNMVSDSLFEGGNNQKAIPEN